MGRAGDAPKKLCFEGQVAEGNGNPPARARVPARRLTGRRDCAPYLFLQFYNSTRLNISANSAWDKTAGKGLSALPVGCGRLYYSKLLSPRHCGEMLLTRRKKYAILETRKCKRVELKGKCKFILREEY